MSDPGSPPSRAIIGRVVRDDDGLPSAGASVAFADEHSDRLYVVRENDDGMLYLALSDALAAECESF